VLEDHELVMGITLLDKYRIFTGLIHTILQII